MRNTLINLGRKIVYALPVLIALNRLRRARRQGQGIEADGRFIKLDADCLLVADTYKVLPNVALQDFIFRHHAVMAGHNLRVAYDAYLANGHKSSETIRDLVAQYLGLVPRESRLNEALTLLDFASGYGCVARHMRNVFPSAHLTTVDIHEAARAFNAEYLGLSARLSASNPEHLELAERHDVVFALSFFSHIPRRMQLPWLRTLANAVAPGGLLIFTTHGATSHQAHMPHIAVDAEGYGFVADSEQFDLPVEEYGSAVTYRSYIERNVAELPQMQMLGFHAALWWGHQDTFVLRKRL